MKKILITFLIIFCAIKSYADINYEIDKYNFLTVSFINNTNLSLDTFKTDLEKSFCIALSKKCKGIQYMDSENRIFKYVNDIEFQKSDSIIKNMCNFYSQEEAIKSITRKISDGKNVIKTYKNGELISTSKSDANYGAWEYEKTVTTIGYDKYETIMYYEGPEYSYNIKYQSKLKNIYK